MILRCRLLRDEKYFYLLKTIHKPVAELYIAWKMGEAITDSSKCAVKISANNGLRGDPLLTNILGVKFTIEFAIF